MEIITSIANWLFTGSIYGIVIIAGAIYLVAKGIKKIIPAFPNPEALGAFAFLIALFTIPSIPRFQFEKDALSQIEGKNWVRVINKTKWGSIIEPLTWGNAPYGSFFIVMPEAPPESGFREVLLRYEQDPKTYISNPDCANNTISRAAPDKDGVFRYTSTYPEKMTEQDKSIYCDYDWSKEREALRQEVLKLFSNDQEPNK